MDELATGVIESFNSHHLTLLGRSSCVWKVRADDGTWTDLGHYFAAWVTPHAPAVLKLLRKAAERLEGTHLGADRQDEDKVTAQVKALYETLAKEGLTYINSILDFGAGFMSASQRVRLPSESLEHKAANCIDGTVLLASLLEAATLRPAIVMMPGHALLGWECCEGAGRMKYLETTMIGTTSFEEACRSGQQQVTLHGSKVKVYEVSRLRSEGIWPME